jgi:hypothetical protein
MEKKAISILIKTYWSASGWNRSPKTDPEDFEYAKSKGLMFDPASYSIPEVKALLADLITAIPPETIIKGFLSSLTNRRLDWRSAMGSYFNARLVLAGKRPFYSAQDFIYQNVDLNVLNFERIKWSGVRHHDLLYNYLDLKLFQAEEIPEPTPADLNTFKNILNCIATSSEGDYPSKLRDRLKLVMKGSKNERHTLMEILGACEILRPESYDRPTTGRHDWTFVEYWRGADSFNTAFIDNYFKERLNELTD